MKIKMSSAAAFSTLRVNTHRQDNNPDMLRNFLFKGVLIHKLHKGILQKAVSYLPVSILLSYNGTKLRADMINKYKDTIRITIVPLW